jgi:dihydrodipicolinate synthase/N-acetylneuraminate lyase
MPSIPSIAKKITGPLVPIMPAFDADENLDLDSTCRWVDWQIESGTRLFWTTYGTSHYMSLNDDEIVALNQAVAGVTRNRAVFIASTNFTWSVERCLQFIADAKGWGANVAKIQVDWRWDPSQDAVFDYYQRIAAHTALPLFGYTLAAPNIKGMSRSLLARIATLPQFIGIKNDSGDFYEQCDYLRGARLAGSSLNIMTGGSMSSFLHNHRFGARAYATGLGIVLPRVVQKFHAALQAERFATCARIIRQSEEAFLDLYASLPVSHWACFHVMLAELGLFRSDRMRFPLLSPQPADRKTIVKVMRAAVKAV